MVSSPSLQQCKVVQDINCHGSTSLSQFEWKNQHRSELILISPEGTTGKEKRKLRVKIKNKRRKNI